MVLHGRIEVISPKGWSKDEPEKFLQWLETQVLSFAFVLTAQ
jgi:hypothetical protein